jgi:hypothetical protein
VTVEAGLVPDNRIAVKPLLRWGEENSVDVNPASLDKMIRERQADISTVVIAMKQLLEPVRTNQAIHRISASPHGSGFVEGNALGGRLHLPRMIDSVDKEAITRSGHARGNATIVVDGVIKICLNILGSCLTGHGAVEGILPAGVMRFMALKAVL